MASESFRIAYDGPAVRDGKMDAREFADALLGLGEVCARTNDLLNGDRATVTLRITAGAQPASFPADLELYQDAQALIEAIGPSELLRHLGLTAAVVFEHPIIWNILDLWKRLKGEPAEVVQPDSGDGNAVVNINGEHNHVNVTVLNLYDDRVVREHLPKVFKPLAREGVDEWKAEQGGQVVSRVNKAEAGVFAMRWSREATVREGEREVSAEVISMHYRLGYKWRFASALPDLGLFTAEMKDLEFMLKLEAREIYTPLSGDRLRFRMKTIAKRDGEKESVEHEILEVYGIDRAPRQAKLV